MLISTKGNYPSFFSVYVGFGGIVVCGVASSEAGIAILNSGILKLCLPFYKEV